MNLSYFVHVRNLKSCVPFSTKGETSDSVLQECFIIVRENMLPQGK